MSGQSVRKPDTQEAVSNDQEAVFRVLGTLFSRPEAVARGRAYRIEDLMRIWDCGRRKVQDDLRDLGVRTRCCGRTEHVTGDQIIDAIEGVKHERWKPDA